MLTLPPNADAMIIFLQELWFTAVNVIACDVGRLTSIVFVKNLFLHLTPDEEPWNSHIRWTSRLGELASHEVHRVPL